MQSIYLLMDALTRAANEQVHFPDFTWRDRTQQELFFRGHRINIAAFKAMFHSLLEKCEAGIGSLLLDFPIESLGLNVGEVFDNLSDPLQPGRSLFSHPSNPLEQGGLARRLCTLPRTDPRSEAWIATVVDRQVVWDARTVRKWEAEVNDWLADFHTLTYIGQHSKRGVEFRSICLHDLEYTMAGVRAFDGKLYLVISTHKQDHVTGQRKSIPLFLHHRVSRLLHLFMVVRDHQIEMAQVFAPKAVPQLTTYLWASFRGPWIHSEVKTVLERRTVEHLGVKLGVSKVRQLLCFLWPAKIGEAAANDALPDNSDLQAINVSAAHSAQTAAQHYGVLETPCPTMPEPVFRAIYEASVLSAPAGPNAHP